MAVNYCGKAATTPFTSIARRKRFLPFRAIAKSSNSPREKSARIWKFRVREFAPITKSVL
jgi:hypothetical protein